MNARHPPVSWTRAQIGSEIETTTYPYQYDSDNCLYYLWSYFGGLWKKRCHHIYGHSNQYGVQDCPNSWSLTKWNPHKEDHNTDDEG
ncbi:uncharacterized protein METZ01_LOCUS43943 [marine metagenome]|uniref:Uncharacterized protein n=1 Tax=marine metagenome TaxID=408172 RepID=A0A381RJH9_9ZZZZ